VQLYKDTEYLETPDLNTEQMLAEILATPKEVAEVQTTSKVIRFPNWAKLAIAASIIAALTFLFFPRNNTIKLATSVEETKNITLPDGSTCVVEQNSQLTYEEENWLANRIVHLNGEATFGVKTGDDFRVVTQFGKVNVLGTVFKVQAINDSLKVSCAEGKVQVSNLKDDLRTVITANEKAIVVNNQQITTQKRNLTKLDHVTLQEVIDALAKQFKITFNTGSINLEERLTCNFQHENLEKALETTLSALNIQYQVKNDTVIL